MKWLGRKPKHRHAWRFVAQPIGGTGWSIYECDCGERSLA